MTKGICKQCGNELYIVNMTHFLCDKCNQLRLHGKSKFERTREKRPKIKKTKKQSRIDGKYASVVKEIKNEREPCCESCGMYVPNLSISHIISRKRCKELGRPELVYEKANLLIECFEAPTSNPTCCHNLHELGQPNKIMHQVTFDYKMEYIQKNDPQQFQILISKIS